MQQQKLAPVYGITKTEYARQLQELVHRTSQPNTGFFARLRNKFR